MLKESLIRLNHECVFHEITKNSKSTKTTTLLKQLQLIVKRRIWGKVKTHIKEQVAYILIFNIRFQCIWYFVDQFSEDH